MLNKISLAEGGVNFTKKCLENSDSSPSSHFTGQETEAQRNKETHPRSHNWSPGGPGNDTESQIFMF